MKKLFFIGLLALCGCDQPEKSKEILTMEGYENIQITGYVTWGCSDSDTYHTGFTAKKNGHDVHGVVCSGYMKGATIRIL